MVKKCLISEDTTNCTRRIHGATLPKMFSCAAGPRHSLFVSEHGNLYAFGALRKGVAGIDFEADDSNFESLPNSYARLPVAINFSLPVLSAACGSDHSLILTAEGTVFAAGVNNFGQCGINSVETV